MLTLSLDDELPNIFCKSCETEVSYKCVLSNKIGRKIHLLHYWCANKNCKEYLQLKEIENVRETSCHIQTQIIT